MFTVTAISRAPSFSGGETKTGPFPAETDLRGISRLPEALLALKSSWRASGLAVLRAPLGARTAHIVPFRAIAAGQRPKQGLSQLDQARHGAVPLFFVVGFNLPIGRRRRSRGS